MPIVGYNRLGTYRCVIVGMPDETGTIGMDTSKMIVSVSVDADVHTSVSYQVRDKGTTNGVSEGELHVLRKNGHIFVAFPPLLRLWSSKRTQLADRSGE